MNTTPNTASAAADQTAAARRWLNNDLRNLFDAEIANEDNGGISPSTLSSTIDSVAQMPADILAALCATNDTGDLLTSLLVIRDLLPGDTPIADLLD